MPNVDPDAPVLPLPAEGHGSLSYWTSQIKDSEEKRNRYKDLEWDKNIQSYLGKSLTTVPEQDTVTVPKDFANVERKKAELFFQNPDVNLTPKFPGLEDAVSTFQAVLNHYLGPERVDAGAMMTEVTFDACMTGLMVSKIGYENVQDGETEIQTGTRELPAEPIPGSVLGLTAPAPQTEPIMEPAPNIIHERYFWERVSPAKLLLPVTFQGFVYDRAPWIGFEFEDEWDVLKRRYDLPDDLEPGSGRGDQPSVLKSEREDAQVSQATKRVKAQEIWYRAALYDPDVKHPDLLRYLVLIDGLDEPVRHEDSPYQRLTPEGKIQGMRGFPVHVGALRYVSDTAYPAAETTIGRPQVQELSKSRTQMLLQRDRNVPMRFVDVTRIGGEPGLDKLRRNVWQSYVPIMGLDVNQPPVMELARSSYPPEDFQFNTIISRDLDEVWAFGPNQRGLETAERKTATEIRNIQSNVSARLDLERRHAIRYYVQGAEKLGALIQLFADETDYVEVVGQDGGRRLQAWNKDAVAGEFVYDARPDSAVRVDAAQEFSDVIEMYNLTGKDPHANRVELLTRMARLRNIDVTRFVVPELPESKPEPPKISFAIKGELLDTRNPNFPILQAILEQAGYKIPPEAIQAANAHAQAQGQILNELAATSGVAAALPGGTGSGPTGRPQHPGAMPQMDRLSKHQSDRSGELSGPRTDGRPQ